MVTLKYAWQDALSDLITDPKELLTILELDTTYLDAAYAAAKKFPLKVPRGYAARMQKGNIADPLLLQVMPLGIELAESLEYKLDPLHEADANPVPGLLHKYHGRVLVTLTSACAVHCRYCFRRHFPYADNNPGRQGWGKIFAYIKENSTITEVILSGGDPLSVNDKLLKMFSDQLELIPHVKRLRIHSRLPVVLPERVTEEFILWITHIKLTPSIVIHANHPNEINDEVKDALSRLRRAGVQVLNQTVLLKGINDDAEVLSELSEVLFESGVLPYYLHVLDKVQGAAHFDLQIEQAKLLHAQLRRTLPGYLVPRLVCEKPGEHSKTLI